MRWFIYTLFLILALLLIMAIGWTVADAALAGPSTEVVLHDILAAHGSPLADVAYRPVAYWRAHPGSFDLVGWLSVVAAETSLGKDSWSARTRNVGCIRGGAVGRPWRDLRVGVTSGGFNVYGNWADGVRASILLLVLSPRGYMGYLMRDDFRGFTRAYWGGDYFAYPAKREAYIRSLERFHAVFAREGRVRGLAW